MSFSFAAYGSGFLVKVWFVFIVLALEVTPWIDSMFHVFSSIIYGFLLILSFRGLIFSFCVYGLDLLVKVWFVFIVLALEVSGL